MNGLYAAGGETGKTEGRNETLGVVLETTLLWFFQGPGLDVAEESCYFGKDLPVGLGLYISL